MRFNKILCAILLLFLLGLPCYADGGIPLWCFNASAFLALGLPDIKIFPFTCILAIISLAIVILVETFVVRLILKNTNFNKIFFIMGKANIVTTFVGFLVVIAPMIFKPEMLSSSTGMEFVLVGPWGIMGAPHGLEALLLLNILLLLLSYIIEYKVSKKNLINDYEIKDIKKSPICVNLLLCICAFGG